MMPAKEAVAAAGDGAAEKSGPQPAGRRTPLGGGSAAQPVARIMQLVAALKAEQELPALESPGKQSGERVRLLQWLRRVLAAREEERSAWEKRVLDLEAQLQEAQRVAGAAHMAVAEATSQHQRLIADLKLMHEHQRSIWQLERRQLEIALDAQQQARRRTLWRRVARPALAAALLLVFLAALMLSADSHAVGAHAPVYLDDGGRSTAIVLGGD